MNKKFLFFIFSLIFLVGSMVQAYSSNSVLLTLTNGMTTLGIFKKGQDINLIQAGSGFISCNITSILAPNSKDVGLGEVEMNKDGDFYNYLLSGNYTQQLGRYIVQGFCTNGTDNVVWAYDFEVTLNGKEKPSGIVVALFISFFLAVISMLGFLIVGTIDGFMNFDLTLKELLTNLATFFVIVSIYILSKEYLGNLFIENFLVTVIKITAITNVFLPLIAYVLNITVGELRRRKKQIISGEEFIGLRY